MAVMSVRTRRASSAPTDLAERPAGGKAQSQEEMELALQRVGSLAQDVDSLQTQLRKLQGEAEGRLQACEGATEAQEHTEKELKGGEAAEGQALMRRLPRGFTSSVEGVGEQLMKQLLRLDGLAGDASGDETVRLRRREQVVRVQGLLDQVDSLKASIGPGEEEEPLPHSEEQRGAGPSPSPAYQDDPSLLFKDADAAGLGMPPVVKTPRGRGGSKAGNKAEEPGTPDSPLAAHDEWDSSPHTSDGSGTGEQEQGEERLGDGPKGAGPKAPLKGLLKASKFASGEGGEGKQQQEGGGKRRVQFVNLPDRVPTIEDRPPRQHKSRPSKTPPPPQPSPPEQLSTFGTFPRAAVPLPAVPVSATPSASRTQNQGTKAPGGQALPLAQTRPAQSLHTGAPRTQGPALNMVVGSTTRGISTLGSGTLVTGTLKTGSTGTGTLGGASFTTLGSGSRGLAANAAAPGLGSLSGSAGKSSPSPGTLGSLSSSQGKKATFGGGLFREESEEDIRRPAAKVSMKPAVSMEFSTFKPSAIGRKGL